MRNRAKCKLCSSIIESFHPTDYVACKCGEISVSEGAAMRCAALNWDNFLRVDDEGNEIVPNVQMAEAAIVPRETHSKPTKKELLDMLEEMIKNIERLPSNAMAQPVNHYDLVSALLLLSSIFKTE